MAKKSNPQQDLVNLQAQQLALQASQAAAQQEFLRMRFTQLELPQFQHMSEQDKERLAFDKATEAFNESYKNIQLSGKLPDGTDTMEAAMQKAQLTGLLGGEETLAAKQLRAQMSGYYNGQMTTEEQQRQFGNQISQAALTGQYNGQQTTAEQQRQFQNLITQAGLTGQYNGQMTADEAAREAGITGYFQGHDTLAREQEQNKTGLGLMQLGAQLQGPANIFKFMRTFAGTPGGMQDMLHAMAGRYQLPGFTGGNMQGEAYQPSTVASMFGNMNGAMGAAPGYINPQQGAVYSSAPGQTGVPGYNPQMEAINQGVFNVDPAQKIANIMNGVPANVASAQNDAVPTIPQVTPYPEGQTAPVNEYNYQPTGDGQYYVYPPGAEAPQDAFQHSSAQPMSYSDLNSQTGYSTAADPTQVPAWSSAAAQPAQQSDPYGGMLDSLVAPSKINAENYNNMGKFQQQVLQSAYGEKGITPDMFQDEFTKALPRYAGAQKQGAFI